MWLKRALYCSRAIARKFKSFRKKPKNNKIDAKILRGVVSDSVSDVYLTEDALGYQIKISEKETGLKVKAWTMPDIIRQFNLREIDILKIDIEGAEKAILKNADWLKIVKNLLVEIHDDYTLQDLTRDLTPYGFTIEPLNERTVFLAQRHNGSFFSTPQKLG
ncbi:MAG: FkbM family methyltransferase [Saprospiraceae bacterium]|nr:FkbM family methyltransferase [Saprospiraceae bacterium]